MAYHNIDARYQTPYVAETDYGLNGWPRPTARRDAMNNTAER